MRGHEPPYRLGEGVCIAAGSPYGCDNDGEPDKPITEAYFNAVNPAILQGAHGLGIEGIALHRNFVSLSYPCRRPAARGIHDQERGCRRLLAGRPWRFTELLPPALEDDWDMVAADREGFTGDHGEILWTEDEAPTDHTSSSDGASDDHLPR